MATHSNIFAWESMGRGAWRAAVHEVSEMDMTLQLNNNNKRNNSKEVWVKARRYLGKAGGSTMWGLC